jgi:hypothetical protein
MGVSESAMLLRTRQLFLYVEKVTHFFLLCAKVILG